MLESRVRALVAAASVTVLLALPSALPACDATCCLMLTRGSGGVLAKGSFQLELSYRHTDMSARMAGSSHTDEVIRPKVYLETGAIVPGYHQELQGSDSFLQVDASVGVAGRTTLFASLPVATRRAYDIGHGGFTSSYNVHGLGDLLVGVRQALVRRAGEVLVASVGFKLPTGPDDVIDNYDATLLDPTLQPGTGSSDFNSSLLWSRLGPSKTEISLSGSYQRNRENQYGYRFADLVIGAVTVARPARLVTPSLQLKLARQGRSELHGAEVPSTGSTVVYANAGLRYRAAPGLSFYGYFLAPLYRRVNDAQLAPRFSILVGFAKAF